MAFDVLDGEIYGVENEELKKFSILGGTDSLNEDFISWLQANAVQINE